MTVAEKTMSSSSSFIHHHLNYFLPAVFTITDWLFIILAESCAYSLRNCIMGQFLPGISAVVYPVFPPRPGVPAPDGLLENAPADV